MTTVAELLLARAEDDATGLRYGDGWWTWRQVVEESVRRASWLEGQRRSGPFHVGVLLENEPEYLFLLGGAALAGATVVGINPTRRGTELAGDIHHTDCQLLVTDTGQLPLIEGLDTGVAVDRIFVVDDPARAPVLPAAGAPPAAGELPGADSLFLLLFTSGSTGAPKAVRVSQGRLADAGLTMATGSGFGAGDVLYCAMPMFHGNALNTCIMPAMAAGACLVLRRRFSASGFLPDVRYYGVTYFNYVGRALAYILATPPAADDAENTLRFGFGTDASPSDISSFKKRFRCPIIEGYGSSEGAIAMSRVPGTPRQAVGLPLPGTDVAIVDPVTGTECPPARIDDAGLLLNAAEAIGEIVSRNGASRFEGYYANEEANAERTRDGWYWSGDLGYRDEAGFFYFAGRPADWLRVDGENFAAAPVERILARYDGVVTACVYPVPDPRTGDQVMATLELVPGTVFDPLLFTAFLADQQDLGSKWAPRFVRITRNVPLTGTNKIDKRPLRSERWVTDDPVWWRPFGGRHADGAYRVLGSDDVESIHGEFETHGRTALLGF
ncbi:MAG TPA: AMP-binding protein [Acidimicrobiales bacterium]|nr:AMP-binding protein [Acidimicrobiales bacterium]